MTGEPIVTLTAVRDPRVEDEARQPGGTAAFILTVRFRRPSSTSGTAMAGWAKRPAGWRDTYFLNKTLDLGIVFSSPWPDLIRGVSAHGLSPAGLHLFWFSARIDPARMCGTA